MDATAMSAMYFVAKASAILVTPQTTMSATVRTRVHSHSFPPAALSSAGALTMARFLGTEDHGCEKRFPTHSMDGEHLALMRGQ